MLDMVEFGTEEPVQGTQVGQDTRTVGHLIQDMVELRLAVKRRLEEHSLERMMGHQQVGGQAGSLYWVADTPSVVLFLKEMR